MLKDFLSELPKSYNIILANGEFPSSNEFLTLIKNAQNIISCDGATKHLIAYNIEPTIIIGDCDSLSNETLNKFHNKIVKIRDQSTNDLSKAVQWAHAQNLDNIIILGATGLREDHTLANIGLMTEYAAIFERVWMISLFGVFTAHTGETILNTAPGQQISFFATQGNTQITALELKWPLQNFALKNWHSGTLNEATGTTLRINSNPYSIIYRSFEVKVTAKSQYPS